MEEIGFDNGSFDVVVKVDNVGVVEVFGVKVLFDVFYVIVVG